ncbi:unnamed protein product, partial [Symbiodinium sp. KB8]
MASSSSVAPAASSSIRMRACSEPPVNLTRRASSAVTSFSAAGHPGCPAAAAAAAACTSSCRQSSAYSSTRLRLRRRGPRHARTAPATTSNSSASEAAYDSSRRARSRAAAASAAPAAAAWRDAVAALPPSADVGSCVKCGGALRQAPAGDEDPRFRAVGVAAAGSCDLVVSLGDPRSDPACLRVWQGVAAACPRVGVHTRGGGALEPSDAGEAADAWSDAGGRDRDRDSPMGGGEGSAAVPGADWRDGVRDVWVEAEPSAGAEQLCRALQAGQSGETAGVAHGGVAMMAARATVLRAQAAKAAAAVPAAGAAGL